MATSKWVLGLGTVAVVGYFALSGVGPKDLGYSTIGLASIIAVLVAVNHRRPTGRRYWYLLAAGNLCFVLGDGVYDVYQFVLHLAVPYPSVADALYLLGYPFVFAGVRGIARVRGGFARESYADAAIISIGALALSWHFLMGSEAHSSGMSTFAKLVTIAYPMMDIVILFVVLQALMFGVARQPVHKLLAASLLSMLVADFIYDVLTQHSSYSTGNPVDEGWLIAYVLIALAAWHPSMELSAATQTTSSTVDRHRLPVVALAGFVSPAILSYCTTGRYLRRHWGPRGTVHGTLHARPPPHVVALSPLVRSGASTPRRTWRTRCIGGGPPTPGLSRYIDRSRESSSPA